MTTINNNEFPKIKITHVSTGTKIEFDAYMERFSDNFNSQWESTDVFGRMDDIRNFKRTTRTIELGWTVISEDQTTAEINYKNCSTLMAMLYPVYKNTSISTSDQVPIDVDVTTQREQISERIEQANIETEGAIGTLLNDLNNEITDILSSVKGRQTALQNTKSRQASIMSSPPIFKINFANLIRSQKDSRELYGTIEGFKYEPDMEMGFFIQGQGDEQMMYPKVVSLSFAFTVIHTAPLGWEFSGGEYKLRNPDFPFYKKK